MFVAVLTYIAALNDGGDSPASRNFRPVAGNQVAGNQMLRARLSQRLQAKLHVQAS